MIKLNFLGEIKEIECGLGILCKQYGVTIEFDGLPINVEMTDKNILEVRLSEGKGLIRFNKKNHFFRGFGLFIEALRQEENFYISEIPQFTTNGILLDVSRNAVLKTESIKTFIDNMAVMGLNMMMLYTEDTYTIQNKPYFGYMRGRYSFDEIKSIDDYADVFGIEVIPCIQTLAHLKTALKWEYAASIIDTNDILLVGNEDTYKFIDEMIKAASAPVRSKRIHIGMDEAHNLGLGKYLDENGYRRRFDIMNEHLARVREIAYSNGLKPMMWADMYFRLASKTGNYRDLDAVIPQDVIDKVSKDVQMVCWDYYHNDSDFYREFIKRHKRLGCDTIFAGGIWTWNGVAINYTKTFLSTNAALSVCKEENIREVFATMWGDNGAETDLFTSFLGLQLYAEHGYSEELNMDKLKKRFEFCTGASFDSFMLLDGFDNIPATSTEKLKGPSNPSKLLLWQDVLIGLFDRHFEGFDMDNYYLNLSKKLEEAKKYAGKWEFMYDVPLKLAKVLSIKSDCGKRIKASYDMGNMSALKEIAEVDLPQLYKLVNDLRVAHRELWMKNCKPFGWEVLDLRYGGLLARIETASFRILEYTEGKILKIEELEEERLFFDGPDRPQGQVIGRFNLYNTIATASPI